MADFECQQLEIGLEFMRWSFTEHNNFSKGSSDPKKDTQAIREQGAATPWVSELKLLVLHDIGMTSTLTCLHLLDSGVKYSNPTRPALTILNQFT